MSLRDSFKSSKSFRSSKSVTILAKWCNGSTTDSGSVCLGSNPSLATKRKTSLLGGLLFFGKLLDSNPPNRGPRKFLICGESEDVRLLNVARQHSLQQAQSERRILVWQQNPLENHHIFA